MKTLMTVLLSAFVAIFVLAWLSGRVDAQLQPLAQMQDYRLALLLLQLFSIIFTAIFGIIAACGYAFVHIGTINQQHLATMSTTEVVVCCLMVFSLLAWAVQLIWVSIKAHRHN